MGEAATVGACTATGGSRRDIAIATRQAPSARAVAFASSNRIQEIARPSPDPPGHRGPALTKTTLLSRRSKSPLSASCKAIRATVPRKSARFVSGGEGWGYIHPYCHSWARDYDVYYLSK